MPGWLAEVLKALGFTTPFIYAAATYGLFHLADKKASGQAKRAISGWLEPKEYDKAAVSAAIIEMFDRVYTRPLLSWRALFRSALITFAVTLIVLREFAPKILFSIFFYPDFPVVIGLLLSIALNIMFDFLALFIIKWLLRLAINPVAALIIGPALGMCLVATLAILRLLLLAIFFTYVKSNTAFVGLAFVYLLLLEAMGAQASLTGAADVAALLVHLWLPLFALCVGLAKGLNYVLLATKRVQWFLKRGKEHPFDALGFVAAPLVFLGLIAVQAAFL